jgi:hypothetical protein
MEDILMKLKVTNPYGQSQMFFDVKNCEYYDGLEHITLKDGTTFTVNTWKGWSVLVVQ